MARLDDETRSKAQELKRMLESALMRGGDDEYMRLVVSMLQRVRSIMERCHCESEPNCHDSTN